MNKQVFNPYMPSWEYVPDGEPHVFGDRVYVYGSHDLFNGWAFCLGDYVCYSAPVDDLADWRYSGWTFPRRSRSPRACIPCFLRTAEQALSASADLNLYD